MGDTLHGVNSTWSSFSSRSHWVLMPDDPVRCQVIDEVRCKVHEREVSVVILDFSHVPAIDAALMQSLPPNFLYPSRAVGTVPSRRPAASTPWWTWCRSPLNRSLKPPREPYSDSLNFRPSSWLPEAPFEFVLFQELQEPRPSGS